MVETGYGNDLYQLPPFQGERWGGDGLGEMTDRGESGITQVFRPYVLTISKAMAVQPIPAEGRIRFPLAFFHLRQRTMLSRIYDIYGNGGRTWEARF